MASEFDSYAASYDDVLAAALGGTSEVDRFAEYKIVEMAHRLAGMKVRSILDFGCGVGRSLSFLTERFPDAELWGYEPSIDCATAAQSRVATAHVTDDYGALPTGAFDCLLAANVFHHVPPSERRGELERCRDLLAPGGSLFVFEHNPFNPVTRRVFERCPFDRDASMIRAADMVRLGEEAGLRASRRAYTLFVPWRSAIATRFERLLRWLPLGAQYYVQFVR